MDVVCAYKRDESYTAIRWLYGPLSSLTWKIALYLHFNTAFLFNDQDIITEMRPSKRTDTYMQL